MLHTALLIAGMASILALSSRLLFGPDIWWGIMLGLVISMLTLPNVSPYWLLRFYQARPIHPAQSPQLSGIVTELARRAGLPRSPELFWIPSQTLNAFAVGSKKQSAIALTQGLLENLSVREIAGVMAHETSHIRNNDLRIMTLADLITRLTHTLSVTAFFLILVSLPLMIADQVSISLLGLFILLLSPNINALLQLGLSRVREFDADLDAARLTRDPEGLASALARIEMPEFNWMQRIMLPGYREHQPSILRSHPLTRERIDRLLKLREQVLNPPHDIESGDHSIPLNPYAHIPVHKPKHRFFGGTWH